MLAKMIMKLDCVEGLSYQMSSLFHGVLMELLPADYAEVLHQSRLHPYAQHLEYADGKWYWVVSCLNEQAVNVIIHDTLEKLKIIEIKKQNITISITQKEYKEIRHRDLMDRFYEENGDRYIQVHFVTPTAFKQQGKYSFYPDLRCIYQSLMNKYDSVLDDESMVDEETLQQLYEHSEIIRYDLKSVYFHLEGTRIPSFIGKVTIKLTGTQTMTNFANLLFEFGTYSGVGIKTALGMGNIRLIEQNIKKEQNVQKEQYMQKKQNRRERI